MRLLSVAFPDVPVGTPSAGGAEQILATLDRGLVAKGEESFVIAAEGSVVAGQIVPARRCEYRERIEQAVADCKPDLVHFHGHDFYGYVPRSSPVMLATLHLPISWYPHEIFSDPRVNLNCVSSSQAASSHFSKTLPVIPNGIPIEPAPQRAREYLLWLGRICPEKGTDIALAVAHELDAPLIVAGPVYPYPDHQRYFQDKVKPLLDHKRTWVGPVDHQRKIELLAGARCVVIPSLVPETSSLTAMEAIMCGAPVVAFRAGALPETVEHGRTGLIVGSQKEMVEAIDAAQHLCGDECRIEALLRFDARRMIHEYIELYRSMTTRHFAAA